MPISDLKFQIHRFQIFNPPDISSRDGGCALRRTGHATCGKPPPSV